MYDNRKYIDLERKEISYKKIFLFIFFSFISSYLIVFILQLYFFLHYKVKSNSMFPKFKKHEKVVIVINSYLYDLKRNDIVLVKHPSYENSVFLSRIKALPNEVISIKDKIVFINQKRLEEKPYHNDKRVFDTMFSKRDNYNEIKILKDHYFLLSDNRDSSFDSRNLGLVNREHILGKVIF